jgi:hypothetical protein
MVPRPQLPRGPIVQSRRDQIAQKHAEGQQSDEFAETVVAYSSCPISARSRSNSNRAAGENPCA